MAVGSIVTRSDNDPAFQPDGAVVRCGDDATWTLLPAQPSLAKAIMATVVPVGTGFVALGSHDDGGVAAWTSPVAPHGPWDPIRRSWRAPVVAPARPCR